jgi:hypothetical protein
VPYLIRRADHLRRGNKRVYQGRPAYFEAPFGVPRCFRRTETGKDLLGAESSSPLWVSGQGTYHTAGEERIRPRRLRAIKLCAVDS